MFSSELCIYAQDEYFLKHTTPSRNEQGDTEVLAARSLSQSWGLIVPEGMAELGLSVDYRRLEDKSDWFVGERWYFGEVR